MDNKKQDVKIVGVDIPFWDKVGLMVGFALASIPALIIIGVIGAVFFVLFFIVNSALGKPFPDFYP